MLYVWLVIDICADRLWETCFQILKGFLFHTTAVFFTLSIPILSFLKENSYFNVFSFQNVSLLFSSPPPDFLYRLASLSPIMLEDLFQK